MTAPREAPVLEVSDLTTRFDTKRGAIHAVESVSLRVERGEIVGIVGESGSGKSATLRSMLALIRPPGKIVAGSVKFNGVDLLRLTPSELRAARAGIGFVAQNPFGVLHPMLKIGRQFRTLLRAHDRESGASAESLAAEALRAVGVPGPERVLSGYPHQLSGGMAQRVVLGMAIALGPEVILADEPTTALDVTVQRQLLDLLHDLARSEHRSLLMVTHDLGVVAQYCDRVYVMYAGRIIESGPVKQVLVEPAHPYTAGLLRSIPSRGRSLRPIGGVVPSLLDESVACPYLPRCSMAIDRCEENPELLSIGGDVTAGLPRTGSRAVACHRSPKEVRDFVFG